MFERYILTMQEVPTILQAGVGRNVINLTQAGLNDPVTGFPSPHFLIPENEAKWKCKIFLSDHLNY